MLSIEPPQNAFSEYDSKSPDLIIIGVYCVYLIHRLMFMW